MIGFISQLLPHLGKKFPQILSQKSRELAADKTHPATPTATIGYSIVHALPGRVRFHVPEIAHNWEYIHRMEELLKAEPGVTSVRVNSTAASIVITYKFREIPDLKMHLRLASLIQSASEPVAAIDSTVTSAGRDIPVPASSSSHPQPTTPLDEPERQATPPEPAKEAAGATDAVASTQRVTQESVHSQPATSSRFEPSTISPASTEFDSRVFVYEVVGLHQSEETDKLNYPIRHSGSVLIRVPYNRMNQEMQWIARLGGKIVSVQPLRADSNLTEWEI
jgi:hypothetical protein